MPCGFPSAWKTVNPLYAQLQHQSDWKQRLQCWKPMLRIWLNSSWRSMLSKISVWLYFFVNFLVLLPSPNDFFLFVVLISPHCPLCSCSYFVTSISEICSASWFLLLLLFNMHDTLLYMVYEYWCFILLSSFSYFSVIHISVASKVMSYKLLVFCYTWCTGFLLWWCQKREKNSIWWRDD